MSSVDSINYKINETTNPQINCGCRQSGQFKVSQDVANYVERVANCTKAFTVGLSLPVGSGIQSREDANCRVLINVEGKVPIEIGVALETGQVGVSLYQKTTFALAQKIEKLLASNKNINVAYASSIGSDANDPKKRVVLSIEGLMSPQHEKQISAILRSASE